MTMPFTILSRNILIAVSLAVVSFATCSWTTSLLIALVLVGAAVLLSPSTKHPSMTFLDCYMLGADRLYKGRLPQGNMTGIFWMTEPPSSAEALQSARILCSTLKRFRSIPDERTPCAASVYVDADGVDMKQHVHEHQVEGEGQVYQLLNQQVNTTLPVSAPLWRMTIARNTGQGRSAMLLTINHCLGDGLRFVSGFGKSQFVTFEDGSPAKLDLIEKMSKRKSSRVRPSIWKLAQGLIKAITLPMMGGEVGTSALHRPLSLFDPKQRVSISDEIQFNIIKEIRTACGIPVTVTDVLYAGFGGAIDRYIQAQDPSSRASCMRALMAISMPDLPKMDHETYNNFLLASVELPTGLDPAGQFSARLTLAKQLMDNLKASTVAPMANKLGEVLLGLGLDQQAADTTLQLFSNHSFVFSSVPGYDKPVCVASKPVCRLDAFYPNGVSQLIFITYCNTLSISLCTDSREVTQPELLTQSFIQYMHDWHKTLH